MTERRSSGGQLPKEQARRDPETEKKSWGRSHRYGEPGVAGDWDWASDLGFLEDMAELLGIRVGLAASEEKIKSAVRGGMQLLPEAFKTHYRFAYPLLGRAVLEAFGLEGAMRAEDHSIILVVRDRVHDYDLALRALSFMAQRIYGAEEEVFAGIPEGRADGIGVTLKCVSRERAREVVREAAQLHGHALAAAVEAALDEMQFRAVRNPTPVREEQVWADVLDLQELFASESVTASYGRFFDQRFVNYLASNFEAIGSINWRKFEALVAERFERLGFEVDLGPGRGDGGVHLRVWESGSSTHDAPPTFIVQCKREHRKIEQVVVKALFADVKWVGAQKGLLVATAEWAPGARKLVKTRGYPVDEVNREMLRSWLREMRDTDRGLWLPHTASGSSSL
ncbi:restriction endonuclease [Streptomyces fragilis]|uniref:Restriction endonuclease n=1 Tax=Streptomyces fragilis TaxID=67301 RepID=A0ABV2YKW7_9ACTN|nr:restriction endonuclease [Streptomyces fragilis]